MKDQFKVAPYLGTYYFAVNTKKPPFDDVRVRQALSMVIDRDFLADDIWGGTMIPAYSFIPPGIGNYGEPATASWKDLSPIEREDKAKELLKAAGYGPGGKKLTVEIRYNTSENHKNTSVALANMWKPLNVEVKLRQHRPQDPLRPASRQGRLRRRPRRMDRRLFRPAELPVPGGERQQGPELRQLFQSRVRRPDEAGGCDDGSGGPGKGAAGS